MNEMNKVLKIGVHTFGPLVYKKDGTWKGFEVELWESVAKKIGVRFEYVEEKDFVELLKKTESGEYDLAMAGISRTTDRKEKMAMSFLTLDSGLSAISKKVKTFSFSSIAKRIFTKDLGKIFVLLCIFALVYANIFWFIERGHSVSYNYISGLLESFWWSVVTFSTVGYGDIFPATVPGKIFGLFAIMTGLAIFGLYIGHLSSILTTERMEARVRNKEDLKGKNIGTKKGTSSEDFLARMGIETTPFSSINNAYDALEKGEVDAVVFDNPVLKFDIKKLPDDLVLMPDVFFHQSYAFIMPKNTDVDFLSKLNKEIISSRESGLYDKLYEKYFN